MTRDNKPKELDGALFIGDDEPTCTPQRAPIDPQEDGKAELALEMVSEIIGRMGLQLDVKIREDGEDVVIDISGEDTGRVIGKKGQTIDALQFLINKIVNRFPEGRRHVLLDSGDYRQRREDSLASLAQREAKRAIAQSRVVTLDPMTPRDRRVVHLSLAKFPGVSTRSDGQGTERRVRIIPARAQGQGQGQGQDRMPRRPRPEQ